MGRPKKFISESGENDGWEHPVMKYLIETKYRDRMERIVEQLDRKGHANLLPHVFFGIGNYALSMVEVAEMLKVVDRKVAI